MLINDFSVVTQLNSISKNEANMIPNQLGVLVLYPNIITILVTLVDAYEKEKKNINCSMKAVT
jgi:hypothetical protein